ncbi:MAG TPA: protein translocase subunit SecD [Piscirickettsiaceae bacterium]|nr:protein translocase subunit SecD [Piscirickettsiaceae bacterium]HIQ39980.1 protein translocase subunit SecD [Sulfurivirga caldicuralii]
MFTQQATAPINRYPAWKYALMALVIAFGVLYALPNLFGEDPAVQVSPVKMVQFDEKTVERVKQALQQAGVSPKSVAFDGRQLLLRFNDTQAQLKARTIIKQLLGDQAVVALNLAPATPKWLEAIGAKPMYLGLDLRGGVHFLLDVDMEAAIAKAYERYAEDVRSLLRQQRIRYGSIQAEADRLIVKLRNDADVTKARELIQKQYGEDLLLDETSSKGRMLVWRLSPKTIKATKEYALKQNITTLRNRINELGVAEPIVQQQGERRIVVQLPGVQDTARAKEILGATATLEFRLVDEQHDPELAARTGRIPPGSRLYHFRDGRPILLKNRVIVSGDNVINAQSGLEQQSGSPMVSVTLDAAGGRKMLATTKKNVGKRMAVVYIENKVETVIGPDGQKVKKRTTQRDVINAAVIRDQFANRFQITGLDSMDEAQNLALLLRAGALAAPMEIVEERTVGPSLGQDNINQGFMSVVVGFILVLLFMAWRYKVFGLIANVALTLNLVILIAVLSVLQATLTLPGIAGIVLTVGMAVDANVLIFERIKEELKAGQSIQQAIHAGYEKAFMTIADANITTLLAAIVLFSFGTGPIKGFAVTLSIGILTSMFTAILVTRGIVNGLYGGKRVEKLAI